MRTLILATGLAAIAAIPALAQTGVSRITTANTGTTTTSATGTNGSTVTTSNTTTPSTTTSNTTTSNTTTPNTVGNANTSSSAFNVQTLPPNSGGTGTSTGSGATPANVTTDTTAASNAGPAFGPGPVGTLVPEGNVSIIGTGTTGFAGITVLQQPAPAPAAQAQTPLFDQAAREGLAKEQRRRARGEEPRIIGIAPRTDADLSWQMPDDKIIRY